MKSLLVLRPGATSRRRRGTPTAKWGCTCEPGILLHGFWERTSPAAQGSPQGAAPPHGEPRAAGGRSGADSFRGVKPRPPCLTGSAAAGSHGYPPDGAERSVSTESCPTPRLPRTRVRGQFRDVWPRPLEPETPEAEIWGSRACRGGRLVEVETSGRRLPLGELEYSKAGACHSTWASSREWVSLQAPPPHARQAPLHPCEREVRSLLPPPLLPRPPLMQG